jgi:hypothetical protein
MATSKATRYFLLPLLYVAVILGLCLLQFSRESRFSARVGELYVGGTLSSGPAPHQPKTLSARFGGIELSIGKEGLRIDGANRTLTGWEAKEGYALALLSGGYSVRFSPSGDSNLSVSLSSPKSDSSTSISLRAGGPMESKGGSSFVVRGSGGDFSLPSGTVPEAQGSSSGSLSLAAGRPVSFARLAKTDDKGIARFRDLKALGDSGFEALLSDFSGKAMAGWSKARLSATSTWRMADGSQKFSELALVCYLSEANRLGSFAKARAAVGDMIDSNRSLLTYLSNPILGSVARTTRGLVEGDRARANRIAALVSAKDPSFLRERDCLTFMVDRGEWKDAQALISLCASLDASKLEVAEAVGLLEVANASRELFDSGDSLAHQGQAAADRLIPSVRRDGTALGLDSGSGAADSLLQLRAALALREYSLASGDATLTAVAEALAAAVLGAADDSGFIPASLALPGSEAEGAAPSDKLLEAEKAYELVSAFNPWYPHEVSLYRDFGPGTWAWTIAPELSVTEKGPSAVSIRVKAPLGKAYYVSLFGLPRFSAVRLNNVDNYNTDPEFERYDAHGWLYKADWSALFVKVKHKAEQETVRLSLSK